MSRFLLVFLVFSGCANQEPEESFSAPAYDWLGVYEVTRFAENIGGCEPDSVEETDLPSPYIELSGAELFGEAVVLGNFCATAGACDGGDLFSDFLFAEHSEIGASGESSAAAYGTGVCYLTWRTFTLTIDGSQMVLEETTEQADTPGADVDECVDIQDGWTGERPCRHLEILEGTAQ